MTKTKQNNAMVVFQGNNIRREWHNDEWWFSVIDIVEALTDSADVKQYIKKMRSRDQELNSYWGTICTPLEMIAKDGKKRKLTCANTEGIFRIIQSIPSQKAEPFKKWLAKTGYERIQEIENPELGQNRIREYYEFKGYPKEWIEKRLRGIAIRRGEIAKNTRKELEQKIGKSIISNKNCLALAKRKQKKIQK